FQIGAMPFRGRIVTAAKNKSSSNDEQQNAQQYYQSQKSTAFHKGGCLLVVAPQVICQSGTILCLSHKSPDVERALTWVIRSAEHGIAPPWLDCHRSSCCTIAAIDFCFDREIANDKSARHIL